MGKFVGQPKVSRAVSRCTHYKHSGLLSLRNMKIHKCEQKSCPYLIPITDHPYWEQKEKKRLDKKIKRNNDIIRYGSPDEIADLFAELILKGVTDE